MPVRQFSASAPHSVHASVPDASPSMYAWSTTA